MLNCHITDHSGSLSVVLHLGSHYQLPFNTYLHHHPVSAAVEQLNCLAGCMVLIHRVTLVIA